MKKYQKLTAVIFTVCLLTTSIGYALSTTSLNINQNQIQSLDSLPRLQVENDSIVKVGNIDYTLQTNGTSNFSIARDAVNGDRVYAWGKNNSGQLGVGDNLSKTVPTLVTGLPANANIVSIKNGANFTLIQVGDNTLYATGLNEYGQFGNKWTSTTINTSFSKVYTSDKKISSLSVGSYHAAIMIENQIYIWGRNDRGQLGFGDNTSRREPTLIEVVKGKNIGDVKVGYNATFASILASDGSIESIYAWGANDLHQLGLESIVDEPKPVKLEYLKEKITGFYPGINKIYFTTIDEISSDNLFYGAGGTEFGALGNGIRNGGYSVFKMKQIPTSEKVVSVHIYDMAVFAVAESGIIYGCGPNGFSLTSENSFIFEVVPLQKGTVFAGTSEKGFSTIMTGVVNNLYGWGSNENGQYGVGDTTTQYSLPTLIDPFGSSPTALYQNYNDTSVTVTDAAQQMYNSKDGFNEDIFRTYVAYSDVPNNAPFSMNSTPVVSPLSSSMQITVTLSKYYSKPDSAKSVTPQEFTLEINGFMYLPDSAVYNNSLAVGSKLNINNIVRLMKIEGSDKVNINTFKELFNAKDFWKDNEFTIVSSTVDKGNYLLTVDASKAQSGGLVVSRRFALNYSDLKERSDSSIVYIPLAADTYINMNNIEKLVGSGSSVSERAFLGEIIDLKEFPDTAAFKVDGVTASLDNVKGTGVFKASVEADWTYLNGSEVNIPKIYDITLNLLIKNDSQITNKAAIPERYNSTNIAKLINPNGTSTNNTILNELFNLQNFPSLYTLTIDKVVVTDSTYSAVLTASGSYKNGNIVKGETFNISVMGLKTRTDTDIILLTTPTYINLNNIISLLGDGSDGKNIKALGDIIDLSYFPTGTTYSIKTSVGSADTIRIIDFTASKYFEAGNIIESPKAFNFELQNLQYQPDSSIATLSPSNLEFGAIKDSLKVGSIDFATLQRVISFTSIPDPSTNEFEIIPGTMQVDDGNLVIGFKLRIKNYYEAGNYLTNWKSFDTAIQFTNHTWLIVGTTIGGIIVLILLAFLIVWLKRWFQVNNYRIRF